MTDHNGDTLLLFISTSEVALDCLAAMPSSLKVFYALASKRDGLDCLHWASWYSRQAVYV